MPRTCVIVLLSAAFAAAAGDWPDLYGPNRAATIDEKIAVDWPANGPAVVWKREVGTGYSQPTIVDGKLLVFQRLKDEESLVCRDAATGETVHWEYSYPTAYVDRYGYNDGPRCTPVVADGVAYALGAEGKLHAVGLADGKRRWMRDLNADYAVEQGFFGVGSTPLVEGDLLIVNVGGVAKEAGIVGIDRKTGETKWKATTDGAGYASPVAATVHGKRYAFVFTQAGLVGLEPTTGAVRFSVPFRSKIFESVNATGPLIVGDLVLVSATYNTGALCVRILPDGKTEEVWRNRKFPESHFSNLIHHAGYVYGFTGRHESNAEMFCCELATGKETWRQASALCRGQLLKNGDELLAWGEFGHLARVALNEREFKLLAAAGGETKRGYLKHPTWTPPAISAGKMYLRNETTLLCLDVKPK